ncbi:MAG TPA: M1 family metallopeptidase, partial [Gemmatimonadaceae bacterium]|nr:M1 family metallopeptidase [Gemmatimonadaceae bacterium]
RETSPGYSIEGTIATLRLPRPMLPGDSLDIEAAWSFEVPPDGAPRMGQDGQIYYLAYWYPQVAVYDDVNGWQMDQYLGNAEFYMGYGDYDVSITAPTGWLVAATGALQNEGLVLSTRSRERLARARRSRDPVRIVGFDERGFLGQATAGTANGTLTWRFTAQNVRDFAFGASEKYLWDAAAAVVGDRDGDGRADTALVQTFWRPERAVWAWDKSIRYAQHSVEFLSRYLWPYPYPHMTAVDGLVSCSGMEYPMMTCIGGRRDTLSLYSVTVHEIAHMWFPMQVGSDEKRFAWQDEGLTRFNQAQAMREFFRGYDLESLVRTSYLNLARAGGEVELMRHGDLYPAGTPAYGVASYQKMATNMVSLRALLGDTLFMRAYREYGRRWLYRHPQPQDFFNTFENVSGRDLSWFWRTWWYETTTLDQAIGAVTREGDALAVRIENRGPAPMPVRLSVRRSDGTVDRVELPAEAWLSGATSASVRVPNAAGVAEITIDAESSFPDIDRSNNVWRP